MYEGEDDVLAPVDRVANRIELPPVKLKRRVKYRKMFDSLKHARGTRSVVICVKGEIYETTIKNRAIAEHLTYSFWELVARARNDVRDLNIMNDIESVRLSTDFHEITIFMGGEVGISDYMIYVEQTTAESLPEPKWRIQDVYVQEIRPTDYHVIRIDPVYKFQKALYGKTEKEEQMERAIKLLQEQTSFKKELLQKATIINRKAGAITKNEVMDVDGTIINEPKKTIKQAPSFSARSKGKAETLTEQDKFQQMKRNKELSKIEENQEIKEPEEKNLPSQDDKRIKFKALPSSTSTSSRIRMEVEQTQFQFPEEVTDTIGSEMAARKRSKDRTPSIYLNFD